MLSAAERPLAEFVGADVGICLEIRDLNAQLKSIPTNEWYQRLMQLSFVRRWQQSAEYSKFLAGKAGLEAVTRQPLDQLIVELFGDSVLIAITPVPQGEPVAMLLSRAEREESWDRVLKLWDQLEAHDIQTQSAFGLSYQRRRKITNNQIIGSDIFTAKIGRVIAISESEQQIRNVLSRATDQTTALLPASKILANSSLYQQATETLPKDCSVRLFMNPRAWEATLQKAQSVDKNLTALCKKLEWISLGIEFREGIVVHGVVRHDTAELPAWWRQFVEASLSESQLANRLPRNALAAGELRFDPRLLSRLHEVDPSEKAQRDWQTFVKVCRGLLGRDLFDEILPAFRPGLIGAVVANTTLSDQTPPVDALFAWETTQNTAPEVPDNQPSLREAIDGALLTLLNIGSISHNSSHRQSDAILRRSDREGRSLRWLEGLASYQPSYGISDADLVVATDPQFIRSFWNTSREQSLTTNELWDVVRTRHFAKHPHWLFVNCAATRGFVSEQRDRLSRQLSTWRRIEPSSARQHLDRLIEILSPFDVAFVASQVTLGEVRFTTGLVTPPITTP